MKSSSLKLKLLILCSISTLGVLGAIAEKESDPLVKVANELKEATDKLLAIKSGKESQDRMIDLTTPDYLNLVNKFKQTKAALETGFNGRADYRASEDQIKAAAQAANIYFQSQKRLYGNFLKVVHYSTFQIPNRGPITSLNRADATSRQSAIDPNIKFKPKVSVEDSFNARNQLPAYNIERLNELDLTLNQIIADSLFNNDKEFYARYNLHHVADGAGGFTKVAYSVTPQELADLEEDSFAYAEGNTVPSRKNFYKLVQFGVARERILNQWGLNRMDGREIDGRIYNSCGKDFYSLKGLGHGDYYQSLWAEDRVEEYNGAGTNLGAATLNSPLLDVKETTIILKKFFEMFPSYLAQNSGSMDETFYDSKVLDERKTAWEKTPVQLLLEVEKRWEENANLLATAAAFPADYANMPAMAERAASLAFDYRRKLFIDGMTNAAANVFNIADAAAAGQQAATTTTCQVKFDSKVSSAGATDPSQFQISGCKSLFASPMNAARVSTAPKGSAQQTVTFSSNPIAWAKAEKVADEFLRAKKPAYVAELKKRLMAAMTSGNVEGEIEARREARFDNLLNKLEVPIFRAAQAKYVIDDVAAAAKAYSSQWQKSGRILKEVIPTEWSKFQLGYLPQHGYSKGGTAVSYLNDQVKLYTSDQVKMFFDRKVKYWGSIDSWWSRYWRSLGNTVKNAVLSTVSPLTGYSPTDAAKLAESAKVVGRTVEKLRDDANVQRGVKEFFKILNSLYLKELVKMKRSPTDVTPENSPLYYVLPIAAKQAYDKFFEETTHRKNTPETFAQLFARQPVQKLAVNALPAAPKLQKTPSGIPTFFPRNSFPKAVSDATYHRPTIDPKVTFKQAPAYVPADSTFVADAEKQKETLDLYVQAMALLNLGDFVRGYSNITAPLIRGMPQTEAGSGVVRPIVRPSQDATYVRHEYAANLSYLSDADFGKQSAGLGQQGTLAETVHSPLEMEQILNRMDKTPKDVLMQMTQSLLDQKMAGEIILQQMKDENPLLAIRKILDEDAPALAEQLRGLYFPGYLLPSGAVRAMIKESVNIARRNAAGLVEEACAAEPFVNSEHTISIGQNSFETAKVGGLEMNEKFKSIVRTSESLRAVFVTKTPAFAAFNEQLAKEARPNWEKFTDDYWDPFVTIVIVVSTVVAFFYFATIIGYVGWAAWAKGATVGALQIGARAAAISMSSWTGIAGFIPAMMTGIPLKTVGAAFMSQLILWTGVNCYVLPHYATYSLRVAGSQIGAGRSQITDSAIVKIHEDIHDRQVSTAVLAGMILVPEAFGLAKILRRVGGAEVRESLDLLAKNVSKAKAESIKSLEKIQAELDSQPQLVVTDRSGQGYEIRHYALEMAVKDLQAEVGSLTKSEAEVKAAIDSIRQAGLKEMRARYGNLTGTNKWFQQKMVALKTLGKVNTLGNLASTEQVRKLFHANMYALLKKDPGLFGDMMSEFLKSKVSELDALSNKVSQTGMGQYKDGKWIFSNEFQKWLDLQATEHGLAPYREIVISEAKKSAAAGDLSAIAMLDKMDDVELATATKLALYKSVAVERDEIMKLRTQYKILFDAYKHGDLTFLDVSNEFFAKLDDSQIARVEQMFRWQLQQQQGTVGALLIPRWMSNSKGLYDVLAVFKASHLIRGELDMMTARNLFKDYTIYNDDMYKQRMTAFQIGNGPEKTVIRFDIEQIRKEAMMSVNFSGEAN